MTGVLIRFSSGLAALLLATFVVATLIGGLSFAEDWDKYKPKYSIGSESADWWEAYPNQSTNAGTEVKHPQWVLDALKKKPVLIMDHTTDCSSCKIQKANIEKVLPSFSENITYYDLLADSKDKKAFEILDVYNPTGGEQFVPTTVFITLIKGSDGKVRVAWHSEIDDMTEEQLSAYLKDAIYYYRQNADDWSQVRVQGSK
jgi:hypothetical protein